MTVFPPIIFFFMNICPSTRPFTPLSTNYFYFSPIAIQQMIKQYHSPLEKVIKQQEYNKHLQRIDHILNRHKTVDYFLTSQSRVRHSLNTNNKEKLSQIELTNLKHHRKLDEIRGRKSASTTAKGDRSNEESPYKKKEQKRIEEENLKIIDKIISMKCSDSYVKIKKNVEDYEKMKKRLQGNKSVSVRLPSFKTIEIKSKLVS